jgi:hypothetical protein
MFIRRAEGVIEISEERLPGFRNISDEAFEELMVEGIDDLDVAESILETLQPVDSGIIDLDKIDPDDDDEEEKTKKRRRTTAKAMQEGRE